MASIYCSVQTGTFPARLPKRGPRPHFGSYSHCRISLKRLPKFTGPPPPPPATPYRNLSRTFTGASPQGTLVVKSKTLNKSSK